MIIRPVDYKIKLVDNYCTFFFSLQLRLVKPMVCEPGQRFTLRLGDMTLGTGVVTKINKNMTEEDRLKLMEGKKAREKAAAKK